MRAIAAGCAGLVLLVTAAYGQDGEKAERAAVKKLLDAALKQMEPKVKSDEKAQQQLKEFGKAEDKELDRMARDLKASFKVEKLDPDTLKTIEGQVSKAIKEVAAADLKKAIRDRDANALPKGEIRSQLCWIIGCP